MTKRQWYGQVIATDSIKKKIEIEWDAMDEEGREFYARSYPATLISVDIDPTPYLIGTDIGLEAVKEDVARELERRRAGKKQSS